MCVAAEAANFKIKKPGIQCIAQRWRRLSRPLVSKHALIPSDAGEPVSLPASILGALRRSADRTAVDRLSRCSAHQTKMRRQTEVGKPLGIDVGQDQEAKV
jgi:hypothetical protein